MGRTQKQGQFCSGNNKRTQASVVEIGKKLVAFFYYFEKMIAQRSL